MTNIKQLKVKFIPQLDLDNLTFVIDEANRLGGFKIECNNGNALRIMGKWVHIAVSHEDKMLFVMAPEENDVQAPLWRLNFGSCQVMGVYCGELNPNHVFATDVLKTTIDSMVKTFHTRYAIKGFYDPKIRSMCFDLSTVD